MPLEVVGVEPGRVEFVTTGHVPAVADVHTLERLRERITRKGTVSVRGHRLDESDLVELWNALPLCFHGDEVPAVDERGLCAGHAKALDDLEEREQAPPQTE